MENSTRNKCSIAECDRKCKSRTSELCHPHYDRQYRLLHPRPSPPPSVQRICSFEGCTEPFSARELCTRHYKQRQRGNNLKPLSAPRIVYRRPSQSMTIVERLAARSERATDLLPDLDVPCLFWTGTKMDRRGYGAIYSDGKTWSTHRLVYFLTTGDSPLMVRHRCDRPPCIEPTHLIGGTGFDNAADRIERGRSADFRGDKNSQAKLTWEKVRQIRSDPRLGYVVAHDYGLSKAAISLIRNGHTWKE